MLKNLREIGKLIYRSIINRDKQKAIVWKELKNSFEENEISVGVYESDSQIETNWNIAENKSVPFTYSVDHDFFRLQSSIHTFYDEDKITDAFVLATHINNFLSKGRVMVNPKSQTIDYVLKQDLRIPLLFKGEIEILVSRHLFASTDVFWAFEKLLNEDQPPALIIADLLAGLEKQENDKAA